MWKTIIALLAEKFTVIARDLPGIGDSAIPKDGLDMKTPMTALAIGAERANGQVLEEQLKLVAPEPTVGVLKSTGHWILEENPKETIEALMSFL
jgi:hypothetical protein